MALDGCDAAVSPQDGSRAFRLSSRSHSARPFGAPWATATLAEGPFAAPHLKHATLEANTLAPHAGHSCGHVRRRRSWARCTQCAWWAAGARSPQARFLGRCRRRGAGGPLSASRQAQGGPFMVGSGPGESGLRPRARPVAWLDDGGGGARRGAPMAQAAWVAAAALEHRRRRGRALPAAAAAAAAAAHGGPASRVSSGPVVGSASVFAPAPRLVGAAPPRLLAALAAPPLLRHPVSLPARRLKLARVDARRRRGRALRCRPRGQITACHHGG